MGKVIDDTERDSYEDAISELKAENERLIQYKDYVDTRIGEGILPKTYKEWNKVVEALAKELDQALP